MRDSHAIFLAAAGCLIALAAAGPIARGSEPESVDVSQRNIDITYEFTARELPAGAERIFAWAPIPLRNELQQVKGFAVEGDWPYEQVIEPEYGNRFLRLDLSGATKRGAQDARVVVTYRVTRKDSSRQRASVGARSRPKPYLARFLEPDALVPITGKIAEEARQVTAGAKEPLQQMRRLYDHIVASVEYDKSGTGWGRGDAVRVCDVRKGNCTDFHSLFIAEARALGVPARFIMGLPLPENVSEGSIPGYHCWAEFYIEGREWLPVDASEASKHPEKKDAFFGKVDANRVAFTVGRDIRIPGTSAGPLNYMIYPHVEVDGHSHKNVKTRFSFRKIGGPSAAMPGSQARAR